MDVRRIPCPRCGVDVLEVPLGRGALMTERVTKRRVVRPSQPASKEVVFSRPEGPEGLSVLVDVNEVMDRRVCPECLSKRALRYECSHCGNTGWRGEDLAGVLGVAVSEDGRARLFIGDARSYEREAKSPTFAHPRTPLRQGEVVHRAHAC